MNQLTILLAGFGCSILLTGCSETEQVNDSDDASEAAVKAAAIQPGIHRKFLNLSGNGAMRYAISIPAGYDGSQPTPLVLALHPGGPGIPFVGIGVIRSLVGPGLKDLNPIIIAPDSMGGDWLEPANETAIAELMGYMQSNYSIDSSRILVTGFSMGGQGTWHLGSRSPELFTLAIPIAAVPDSNATWTLPVYAINSDADEEMPLELTQEYIQQLQEAGVDATIAVVSGIPHSETSRFAAALSESIPWIEAHWETQPVNPDDSGEPDPDADALPAAP